MEVETSDREVDSSETIYALADYAHRRSQIAVAMLKTVVKLATIKCAVALDDMELDEDDARQLQHACDASKVAELQDACNAAVMAVFDLAASMGNLHGTLQARDK